MKRPAVASLFLIAALAPIPALAGEPTGFDGVAFETPRQEVVANTGFRAHCHPAPVTQSAARVGGPRVTCVTYDVPEFGSLPVALLFEAEDRLTGYVFYVPGERLPELRAAALSAYGTPAREWEQGRSIDWRWPSGTVASLTSLCRGSEACLTVRRPHAR